MDPMSLVDRNTRGPRCDVTPLFKDPDALKAVVEGIAVATNGVNFDIVAGIDALGFILGTAVAVQCKKGFVPVRKGGKLPVPVDDVIVIDYTGERKTLEVRKDAFTRGQRVLVVDEWIETGSQILGAIQLIEGQGATVAGVAALNIDDNSNTKKLKDRYVCFTHEGPIEL